MSTEKAKNYALAAQKLGHLEDKLDNIAKAIFELAAALETLEQRSDRKN
jgi:hypothetical protein